MLNLSRRLQETPDNAEETLKNLSKAEIEVKQDVIGSADEMAVEANANTARLWSFGELLRESLLMLKLRYQDSIA